MQLLISLEIPISPMTLAVALLAMRHSHHLIFTAALAKFLYTREHKTQVPIRAQITCRGAIYKPVNVLIVLQAGLINRAPTGYLCAALPQSCCPGKSGIDLF